MKKIFGEIFNQVLLYLHFACDVRVVTHIFYVEMNYFTGSSFKPFEA